MDERVRGAPAFSAALVRLAVGWIAALSCASAAVAQYSVSEIRQALTASASGYVDVGALNLPPAFVDRIANRSLRYLFRQRYRPLAGDPPRPALAAGGAASAPAAAALRVAGREIPDERLAAWRRYAEGVPMLAGFRAPAGDAAVAWPLDVPAGDELERRRALATLVARELPRAGLVRTLLQVLLQPGIEALRGDELQHDTLRDVGFPVDLLAYFAVDGRPLETAAVEWHRGGASPGRVEGLAVAAKFEFAPTCPGFVLMTTDGTEALAALRVQLEHARITGRDGSAIDVVNQLSAVLPDTPLWISAQRDLVGDLRTALAAAAAGRRAPLTIVPAPLPVSVWTQDSSKIGRVAGRERGTFRRVTLTPRFASRNEQNSKFGPGESAVFESLPDAVGETRQSPLLFQGGNMLCYVEPKTGARVLLLGEAEVYRNVALGLAADQVLAAFRAELGVDRVEVIPAVSFHLDMEVTIRRKGDGLVACVNDETAAASYIADAGLVALRAAGHVPPVVDEALTAALARNDRAEYAIGVGRVASARRDTQGRFGAEFTSLFTASSAESAAGNAARFLLALDTLTAAGLTDAQIDDAGMAVEYKNYLHSLRARFREREALVAQLRGLGLSVVRVPSWSEEDLSVNYLNGLHTRDAYLCPTFDGFFAALDAAAMQTLRVAFGKDVRIVPIRTAALQSGYGSLHCLVSAYPATD